VTLSAVRRRLIVPAAALAAAVALVLGASSTPAFADPVTPAAEGGSKTLSQQLEAASRGYNDAKAKLDASKVRQTELVGQIHTTEAELARLTDEVGSLAVTVYKAGRVGTLAALLDAGSPDDLLQRAFVLDSRVRLDDRLLRQVQQTKQALAGQQVALDAEIKVEQDQLAEMDKRKKAAEKALAPVGGTPTSGPTGGTANANPAPRNANGTWPAESCSLPDPTGTGGCVTPRTLNALQQARAAGFTRYTYCWSNGSWGEHPLGRACDFSVSTSGFGGVATGADRAYGDQLAGWFIANADRLAVMYVIFFDRIWMSSTGWRDYYGGGTPSGNHENHVHASIS
jgi:peptidoglycan DL-endopeptidase CwlO